MFWKNFAGSCCLTMIAGLGLAGCSQWSSTPPMRGNSNTETYNLGVARAGAPARPSTFSQSLAIEYVAFASTLAGNSEYADADYFARKAIAAERSAVVLPEDNANWAVPLEQPLGLRSQLADARAKLTAVLDGGARDRAPALAAKAQVLYDCWTEQTEANWSAAAAGDCKSGFEAAIAQLTGQPAIARPLINVFFDFNLSRLSPEGRKVVAALAAQLKATPAAHVTLVGKADLTGTDSYDLALARRRAHAVATELEQDGIASSRIAEEAVGKREPPVKTPNGVREPRNRVVEITIH